MIPLLRLSLCLLSAWLGGAAPDAVARRDLDEFAAAYRRLKPAEWGMSYRENLAQIPAPARLQQEQTFYSSWSRRLNAIPRTRLGAELRYQVDALRFEVDIRRQAVELERRFQAHSVARPIPLDGLSKLPDSKAWYALYLQHWSSSRITPEQLWRMGEAEVGRVRGEIDALQAQLGYAGKDAEWAAFLDSPAQWITDQGELQRSLEETQRLVVSHLEPDYGSHPVPPLRIEPLPQSNANSPPGVYDGSGIFYYSFYANRFPRRSLQWLFLHEGVPGHHYQTKTAEDGLFFTPGYAEGWAAYVEDFGEGVGCFSDPLQKLGKWEWDLVRSARLVLDVGIHDRGWSRAQALAWWHDHIPNQDGIAEREVDRVTRWPAQEASYKVGEQCLLQLRRQAVEHKLSLPRFHETVLKRGPVPLPVLQEIVEDELRAP